MMTTNESEIIDLDVEFRVGTEFTICIRVDDKIFWLPIDKIEIEGEEKRGEIIQISLPEDFATVLGLH